MAEYRLHLLDAGGRIERTAIIEAAGDDEAIRLAAGLDDRAAMELWCGERKICRFEARTVAAPSLPRPLA
jgi:hypothetical protein